MDTAHQDYSRAHYGPRAADYLTSEVHAQGEDLDQIAALVARVRPGRVADIGCGGGHVSYRAAACARQVVACDVTEAMLAVVDAAAVARGIGNIVTRQAAAEHLPFADGSFDMVLSRFSAHHWPDLPAALREARRVLAAGGTAMVVDSIAPSAPLLDTHLQAIELLRDPSHVRNYRLEEWVQIAAVAGLVVRGITRRRLRMDFASWVARTRTPPVHQAALRALQAGASSPVRAHFQIEDDGSWMLDTLAIEFV